VSGEIFNKYGRAVRLYGPPYLFAVIAHYLLVKADTNYKIKMIKLCAPGLEPDSSAAGGFGHRSLCPSI
jgi:hypothetical protein